MNIIFQYHWKDTDDKIDNKSNDNSSNKSKKT